jgi:LAO/AO transport system kinase
MDERAKSLSEQNAIRKIREHTAHIDADVLFDKMIHGDRAALSQAITLTESLKSNDSQFASKLLSLALPHTGNSIRIGITGVPGVGKSTFIDVFGSHLTSLGKKVAVLAIDPTSQISGGSILGDKTRMEQLSIDPNAFIRPSPSSHSLGGVARKTREAIILCEAAGFEVILVETVGVGQSETEVHGMTDFFLLLMLSGAGDQLQGIKRGIMEMCDGMLITKADGDNRNKANFAKSEYKSALHLFPARQDQWQPRVEVCSALTKEGIENAWDIVVAYMNWMRERNLLTEKRHQQDIRWMHETIRARLIEKFYLSAEIKELITYQENLIRTNQTTPFGAAETLLSQFNVNS